MGNLMNDFKEITLPKQSQVTPTAAAAVGGRPVSDLQKVTLYNDEEWEEFIEEWAGACLKDQYKTVRRSSGAGDKGIDIAAHRDDKMLLGMWDNYQCKHYKHSIMPNEIYVEIGKIIWYSYQKVYNPPHSYYLIAPRDVGPALNLLLGNTENLKKTIEEQWESSCRKEITKKIDIPLSGDFKKYFDAFDFSIFKSIPVKEILEQFKKTEYYAPRFGLALPPRPKGETPPSDIKPEESNYIEQLFSAYSEATKLSIATVDDLKKSEKHQSHFKRQRESFYHAEGLRIYVRDKVEPGTFESLQDEIYDGVIDTQEKDYENGFECVVAVTDAAKNLPLDGHPLGSSALVKDKQGICHQLANGNRLKWKK